jgi:membrane-associated phospholipid phosphatase
MQIRSLVAGGLLLFCANGVEAQGLPATVFNDFKYGIGDILAVWSSPFRGDGRDYLTAAMLAGGVGVVVLFDDNLGAWIRAHPKAGVLDVLKPFRENGKLKLVDLGAGQSLVNTGAVLYAVGLLSGNANLRDAGIGCVAAEKSNGILRNYLYRGVSRERPLYRVPRTDDMTPAVYRLGDPYRIEFPGRSTWYDNSFFGGHGANIMACVSFMNHRFDLGLVEPVLWTLAAGVNLGRSADQRHWPSDVAIGAIVGFAMGKYVAERSLARARKRDTGKAEGPDGALNREGDAAASWLDGVYVDARGGALLLGWRTTF